MAYERTYFVYILASKSRRLYVSMSSKLEQRVWQHKTKAFAGFTARYNIDRLVYVEDYSDVHEAIERERQLKRWRREKKVALLESLNSTWRDLSASWFDGPVIREAHVHRSDDARRSVPLP